MTGKSAFARFADTGVITSGVSPIWCLEWRPIDKFLGWDLHIHNKLRYAQFYGKVPEPETTLYDVTVLVVVVLYLKIFHGKPYE